LDSFCNKFSFSKILVVKLRIIHGLNLCGREQATAPDLFALRLKVHLHGFSGFCNWHKPTECPATLNNLDRFTIFNPIGYAPEMIAEISHGSPFHDRKKYHEIGSGQPTNVEQLRIRGTSRTSVSSVNAGDWRMCRCGNSIIMKIDVEGQE